MHLTSLGLAVLGVVYADKIGVAWMREKIDTINVVTLERTHLVVSVAFGMLIASGLFLFWPMRSSLLHNPPFYIKMVFVVALIVNSFVIEKFMTIATTRPYGKLSLNERLPLLLSGLVSLGSWTGATVIGFSLFF